MRLTRIVTTAVLAVGAPAAAYGGLSWGSTPSSSASASSVTLTEGDAAAFVECVRAHGLTDFPDVTIVDGRVVLDLDGTSVDPFSDEYRQAVTACEGELPEGVELPTDPEPPTPATPPGPEDGEMPPAAPEAPTAPALPD